MKTVNILGKEYKVAYNFKVILMYEQLTAKPFDVSDITTTTSQMNLNWCCISANNEKAPDYDEYITTLTPNEFKELSEAVTECISEWYKPMISSIEETKSTDEDSKND